LTAGKPPVYTFFWQVFIFSSAKVISLLFDWGKLFWMDYLPVDLPAWQNFGW